MLVGKTSFDSGDSCFGLDALLVEPESNNEASSYITSKYPDLIKLIKSLGIKDEKAHDLLHDVFISICEAEEDGRGYDIDYSAKNGNDNIILVEQFVIGRIKLYAKNTKYRTDVVETGKTSCTSTVCIEVPAVDKNGYIYDKQGNQVMEKKYIKEKVTIQASMCAASYNQGNDVADINDSFQKAYAMATSADTIEDLADFYSLKEQIDYCIDVCSLHDVNILNIFKNMDMLAGMLGDYSKKKKNADSVFTKISELVTYHNELGEALINILTYSSNNRANFDMVLASY